MNTQPTVPVTEVEGTDWIKSSYSNNGGKCVEVADLISAIAVRDSKNPDGPALLVPTTAFASFVSGVRGGRFQS